MSKKSCISLGAFRQVFCVNWSHGYIHSQIRVTNFRLSNWAVKCTMCPEMTGAVGTEAGFHPQ